MRGPRHRGPPRWQTHGLALILPRGERAVVGAWRRIHAARARAPVGEGVAFGGVAAPHVRPLRDPVFALRPVEQRVPEPDGAWGEQPVLLRRALRARPDVLVGHAVTGDGFAETAVGIARAGWLIRDWLLALGWGSAAKAGATPMAATASTAALASGRRLIRRFIVVSQNSSSLSPTAVVATCRL